jgi:hypothetical protein
VDPENVSAPFVIWQPKLDSSIYPTGTQKGGIQSIRSIGSHQDLDVPSGIEPVQLIDELQHRPLHFIITPGTVVKSCTADSVDFIEKDDAGLLLSGHLE